MRVHIIDRGYTYGKLMEYGKAVDDFNTALQLRPDNIFAASQVALLYSLKKDDEERVEKHSKSINQFPDRAAGYIYRSCAYYQLGHFDASFYDKALSDLNVAFRLNPKSSMAYTYRGSVFIEVEQFDKAIEDFNTAISLSPNYDLAYNCRGIAYLKKGDYLKAKDDFERSKPRHGYDVYYCRAKVRRELEKQNNVNGDESQGEGDPMHHVLEIQSFNQQTKLRGKYLEITIVGWERNKESKCTCGIYENEICHYKNRDIVKKPVPERLKYSILKIKVENISHQLIGNGEYHIVDSQGKMYKTGWLCDTLLPDGYESFVKELYDGTNADFYLVFPALGDGVDIRRFICKQNIFDPGEISGWVRDTETFDFKLCPPKGAN